MPAASTRRLPPAALVAVGLLMVGGVARDACAEARDEVLVVARTVQPRVAYRGVPLEDNPVRAQATVFPGVVFDRAMGNARAALPDGATLAAGVAATLPAGVVPLEGVALDERASAGLRGLAPRLATGPSGIAAPVATGLAPLGTAASATGSAGHALRGIGGQVRGALGVLTGGGP